MTNESTPALDSLQRWMQSVIVHPGGVIAGAESAEARASLEVAAIDSICRPSKAMTAAERLSIYNHAYFARLMECLREEYSVLAAALGEELFDTFALDYLQRYPPTTYTLAQLGDRFPEYLRETRPRFADAGADSPGDRENEADWPEFLIDLARLERTINEVFDGPGTEGETLLDHDRLSSITPAQWPEARLTCVPSLRLVTLSYPVNDYFTAIRRGEQPVIPERSPSFIALTRREYRVLRYPLVEAQYELLDALAAGETVGRALARAAAASAATDEAFATDLREWFQTWTAAGFFRAVVV